MVCVYISLFVGGKMKIVETKQFMECVLKLQEYVTCCKFLWTSIALVLLLLGISAQKGTIAS